MSTRTTTNGGCLSIGVCGLGSIGTRHARLLSDRSDVKLFVHDPAMRPELGLPDDVSVSPSFEALLDATDGVVIATPDALHAPQAVAACRAGVPVLVEKPVAGTVADARRIEMAARQTGVPVLVGHVLRHTAVMMRAKELLDNGAIGTPVSFHATVSAYETLELARSRFVAEESDRLPFDYVHEWDYVQLLLGDIERCVAVGHQSGDLELVQSPNVVDVLVTTASGASGTVHLDYVVRFGPRSVRIIGDNGVMEVDLRAGRIEVEYRTGDIEVSDLAEQRDTAFNHQITHFLDVIRGTATAEGSLGSAIRAVQTAEAVVASYRSSAWVDVVR